MLRGILIALVLAALFAATAAAAEAPTRDEYVARLEAICKPGAIATERAMKGAKADVRAERLAVAAKKFAKGTAIYSGTISRISAVPRPEADVARLKQWFTYLDRQVDYLRQITAKLRHGQLPPASRLLSRFIHSGNLANNVVLAFGFNYCSFKFARYG
jgi:hypothetical protein